RDLRADRRWLAGLHRRRAEGHRLAARAFAPQRARGAFLGPARHGAHRTSAVDAGVSHYRVLIPTTNPARTGPLLKAVSPFLNAEDSRVTLLGLIEMAPERPLSEGVEVRSEERRVGKEGRGRGVGGAGRG